ncbi:hypothetical protein [Bacillus sp. JCM 19034]|uniref:hypothetical protein n=1 Tax=Bacillus sp. JCM 19034 TaxID=1481928 RepID=UPI0007817E37|nr:hypothetical protein [Bacillus sp. JCM 19034]
MAKPIIVGSGIAGLCAAAISKQSWTLGKIAQLESPFLLAARNSLMKRIPSSMMKRQAEQLYQFS